MSVYGFAIFCFVFKCFNANCIIFMHFRLAAINKEDFVLLLLSADGIDIFNIYIKISGVDNTWIKLLLKIQCGRKVNYGWLKNKFT